jgi:hypothetical protein
LRGGRFRPLDGLLAVPEVIGLNIPGALTRRIDLPLPWSAQEQALGIE